MKATTIGAACGSFGASLIAGRARLILPSSSSASGPSNRSTANSRSSRSSSSRAASCRGWKRSGLVTREYASSGGPSVPHLSPRMSLPPGEEIEAAPRGGLNLWWSRGDSYPGTVWLPFGGRSHNSYHAQGSLPSEADSQRMLSRLHCAPHRRSASQPLGEHPLHRLSIVRPPHRGPHPQRRSFPPGDTCAWHTDSASSSVHSICSTW